jgi:hypothetical protein
MFGRNAIEKMSVATKMIDKMEVIMIVFLPILKDFILNLGIS